MLQYPSEQQYPGYPLGAPYYDRRGLLIQDTTWVVFDTETTGFSFESDRILEIAAVRMRWDGHILAQFQTLIYLPETFPIPEGAAALHHIDHAMLAGAPQEHDAWEMFNAFVGMTNEDTVLAAHNAGYDCGMMQGLATRIEDRLPPFTVVDTVTLARQAWNLLPNHKLETLRESLKLETDLGGGAHHRALYDVGITAALLAKVLGEHGPKTEVRALRGAGRSPLFCRFDLPAVNGYRR